MPPTLVACLGDSITEGSPYWDSRSRTGDPEGQWQHWAALRHPELRFANHGIWGQRTDEIAHRFDEAVAGADVLIVQGGINDIAQGRSVVDAARTLERLIERGAALGRMRPATSRMSVVLPDPFGPVTTTNAPGSTSRSSPSRIVREPKLLTRPRTAMSAMRSR